MYTEMDDLVPLRVVYAGICGSDINKVKANRIDDQQLPYLGHELVCLAEDGYYYIVNPFICPQICEQCNQPSLIYCDKVVRIGGGHIHSGFSGYIHAPTRNLFRIPTNIRPEVGVLTDAIAVALHALHLVDMATIRRAAVIGAGTIGVLFALVLKSKNCKAEIDIVARGEKLQFLTDHFGNQLHFVDSVCSLHGPYDIVVEAVGGSQTQTLTQAIKVAPFNGTVLVLGAFDEECSTLDGLRTLFYKQLSVKGANSFCICNDDFLNAVAWTFENERTLLPLITDRYVIKQSELSPIVIKKAIMKPKMMKGCIVHEP